MRRVVVVLLMVFGAMGSALAQISIGIHFGAYPELVRLPNYPVYYAPRLNSNLFFYDGLYWVYASDAWYSSSWYDGPWWVVEPERVPLYVLRVPVRYYQAPPSYFSGWRPDAPPRWGDHWGRGWAQQRSGWDRWNRNAAPAPAPLPVYQRQYAGSRYPAAEQQRTLQTRNYRYEPRDAAVRQLAPARTAAHPVPATRDQPAPQARGPAQQRESRRPESQPQRELPAAAPQERPGPNRSAAQEQRRPSPPAAAPQAEPPQHGPAARNPSPAKEAPPQERGRGHGPDKERDNGEGRGPDHGKK